MTIQYKVVIPKKLIPVFSGKARYRYAFGGRGSAKTRTFAKMTAVRAMMFAEAGVSGVILCGREYMNSLSESSMEEIKHAIRDDPILNNYFEIGEKFIRTKNKRVSYLFTGLRQNLDSIKSKARILLFWIDEGENVSEIAYIKAIPSVREDDSEIWVTWNPENEGSPTDKRFRKNPPKNSKGAEMNHSDNPYFPAVLEEERLNDRENLDDATYQWIWEGAYRKNSKAVIFSSKIRISEFEPGEDWDGPYHGVDWGFSNDPTVAVRTWIYNNTLYVERECYRVGLENDHIAKEFKRCIPGIEKYEVRADSARPETISHVKSKGDEGTRENVPKITAVEKWPGSIEDGIAHMLSYKEIVIHERCTETAAEMRKYSYKTDRLTGEILPDIVDKFNNAADAIRYSIAPIIKRKPKVAGLMLPKRLV